MGAGQVGQDVKEGVKEALEETGRRMSRLWLEDVGRERKGGGRRQGDVRRESGRGVAARWKRRRGGGWKRRRVGQMDIVLSPGRLRTAVERRFMIGRRPNGGSGRIRPGTDRGQLGAGGGQVGHAKGGSWDPSVHPAQASVRIGW